MLIDSLTYALERSGALQTFWGKLDAGEDATLGVAASARPFMVAARFVKNPQPTLVLVAGEEAAATFARNVSAYLGIDRVMRFPERSDSPFAAKAPDARQIAQRLQAADALAEGRDAVVVASARALLRSLPPASAGVHRPLRLVAGRELMHMPGADALNLAEFDDLMRALEERGYENTGSLEGPGTFAVKGGVIDVHPGNLPYPVRLDFFGDELDEIRRIVPSTGQTISALDGVDIFAVREFISSPAMVGRARTALKRPARTNPALRELLEQLEGGLHFDGADALLPYLYDKTVTLGDYLCPETLIGVVEPRSLFDDALHASEEMAARAHGSNIGLQGLFADPSALDFGSGQRATYLSLMRVGGAIDDDLPVKRVEVAGHPDKLFGRLKQLVDQDFTVVFSAPNYQVRQDMKLSFVERGLPIAERLDTPAEDGAVASAPRRQNDALAREAVLRVDDPEASAEIRKRRLKRGVVNVVDVEIPLGMIIPKAKLAMISASDTQGASARKPTRHVDVTEITFPYAPGDYVVHAAHGIGHFTGLVQREVDGTPRDYLLIEYAEGDKLYVPVEQLDRVTRYVGPEGNEPRLTRLNTADWSRAMTRARKATKKLAFDLVDVYARRAAVQGFRFGPDTPWQQEMEDAFPYQETADQLAAIADVKADMQSGRPMDRLICGDVGFGKTEVALRAAFKATQDGKQVMVLCPTTILAQQHYTNFRERCEPFGVKVEVLSRFRTPAQQKAALEGFADGSVQILVGTHRLLSRDVNPCDLGLVIIDEEQRFG
ncbi:MAG TPA: transcription-repair coupling factor, partial [Eggerthellaceae bacterium]|nr:transcription-repair coupling factor [Eggerthellaceae bacterium]